MAGFAAIFAGAGCSDDASKTDTSTTEPEDQAQKPPAKPPAAEPSEESDDDDDDAAPTCMSSAEFDSSTVAYHPPAVKAGNCTKDDVKFFDDFLNDNPSASVDDIRKAVTKQSEKCGKCMFGASSDEQWAPIVQAESEATLNGGGCVSVVSGKDACGETYQKWNACINSSCSQCSPDDRQQCSQDAQNAGSPCGDLSAQLFQNCGSDVNEYLDSCFGHGIGAVVDYLCGTGSPNKDGGT